MKQTKRCEALARQGVRYSICDRPLDKDGDCGRSGDHVTKVPPDYRHHTGMKDFCTIINCEVC